MRVSGFRVSGLGFRVGLGYRVSGLGFRVGLGFGVSGLGLFLPVRSKAQPKLLEGSWAQGGLEVSIICDGPSSW